MLTILHNIFVDWLIAPKGASHNTKASFWIHVMLSALNKSIYLPTAGMMSPGFFPLCIEPNVSVYDAHKEALRPTPRIGIVQACMFNAGTSMACEQITSSQEAYAHSGQYTLALVHVTILSGNKTPRPTELQVTSQWNSTKNTAKVLFILALLTALLVTSMMSSAFVVLLPRHFASPCGASF